MYFENLNKFYLKLINHNLLKIIKNVYNLKSKNQYNNISVIHTRIYYFIIKYNCMACIFINFRTFNFNYSLDNWNIFMVIWKT